MQPVQTFGRRGVAAPAAPPKPSYAPPRPKAPESAPRAAAATATDSNVGFLLNLLFGFEGRLHRRDYRMIRVVCYLVFMTFFYGFYASAVRHKGDPTAMLWMLLGIAVVWVLWFWTTLALQVKRWHDRDKSGVWLFIGMIPFIGSIWVLVEMMFLEGTIGPNRFGPSPRGDPAAVAFET